jgi:WD40 repeat protein
MAEFGANLRCWPRGRGLIKWALALAVLVCLSLVCCRWTPAGPLEEAGRFQPQGGVSSIAFSPGGTRLAVGTALSRTVKDPSLRGLVYIWDTDRQKLLETLKIDQWVNCLAYSADGEYLVVGTGAHFEKVEIERDPKYFQQLPGSLIVYRTSDYSVVTRAELGAEFAREIAVAPDASRIAVLQVPYYDLGQKPKPISVMLRDPITLHIKGKITEPRFAYYSVAISPDSETLAIAAGEVERGFQSNDGVRLFELRSQRFIKTLPESAHFGHLAFCQSPKYGTLLAGAPGWVEMPAGKPLKPENLPPMHSIINLACSRDGKWIAYIGNYYGSPQGREYFLWNTATDKWLSKRTSTHTYSAVAISSASELLALAGLGEVNGSNTELVELYKLPK